MQSVATAMSSVTPQRMGAPCFPGAGGPFDPPSTESGPLSTAGGRPPTPLVKPGTVRRWLVYQRILEPQGLDERGWPMHSAEAVRISEERGLESGLQSATGVDPRRLRGRSRTTAREASQVAKADVGTSPWPRKTALHGRPSRSRTLTSRAAPPHPPDAEEAASRTLGGLPERSRGRRRTARPRPRHCPWRASRLPRYRQERGHLRLDPHPAPWRAPARGSRSPGFCVVPPGPRAGTPLRAAATLSYAPANGGTPRVPRCRMVPPKERPRG